MPLSKATVYKTILLHSNIAMVVKCKHVQMWVKSRSRFNMVTY